MGEIVVGYDGSDCGKAALDEAVGLAKGLGDRVVIVFGYAPPGMWGGEIAEHEEAIEEFGEKVTGEALQRAQAGGVEAEVEHGRRASRTRRWSRWPRRARRG